MGRDGPLVDSMQPFILYNIPSVDATTERWSSPEYMEKIFGKNTRYATEHSTDNHFMYFNHKLVSFFSLFVSASRCHFFIRRLLSVYTGGWLAP